MAIPDLKTIAFFLHRWRSFLGSQGLLTILIHGGTSTPSSDQPIFLLLLQPIDYSFPSWCPKCDNLKLPGFFWWFYIWVISIQIYIFPHLQIFICYQALNWQFFCLRGILGLITHWFSTLRWNFMSLITPKTTRVVDIVYQNSKSFLHIYWFDLLLQGLNLKLCVSNWLLNWQRKHCFGLLNGTLQCLKLQNFFQKWTSRFSNSTFFISTDYIFP